MRRAIERLLEADPGVVVAGTAVDGLDALAKIRDLRPDVVTLDVMMPRLDGLKVLACIMRDHPVRVLMLSSLTQEGADETLQALDLGAVDFIDKTALLVSGDVANAGRDLLSKIRTAAAVDPARLGAQVGPGGGRAPGPRRCANPAAPTWSSSALPPAARRRCRR